MFILALVYIVLCMVVLSFSAIFRFAVSPFWHYARFMFPAFRFAVLARTLLKRKADHKRKAEFSKRCEGSNGQTESRTQNIARRRWPKRQNGKTGNGKRPKTADTDGTAIPRSIVLPVQTCTTIEEIKARDVSCKPSSTLVGALLVKQQLGIRILNKYNPYW